MPYTVKEIAELTGVTIKTLHHYHKIGLLVPYETTYAGYRLYGAKELENEPSRLACLVKQQELLLARRQRMDRLLSTLHESIILSKKGEVMDQSEMFRGLNKEEWEAALSEQNAYLKDKYDFDMLESQQIGLSYYLCIAAELFAAAN